MTYYKMFVTCWLDNGKLRKPQECFHTRNLLPDLLAFLVNPSFSMYRDLHSRRSLQIFRESRAFEKNFFPSRDLQWHGETLLLSAADCDSCWLERSGPGELECSCCRQLESRWGFVSYSGYGWSDNWFPCFDLICSLKCLFSQRSIN